MIKTKEKVKRVLQKKKKNVKQVCVNHHKTNYTKPA